MRERSCLVDATLENALWAGSVACKLEQVMLVTDRVNGVEIASTWLFRTHDERGADSPGSRNMGRFAKTPSQDGASEPAPVVRSRKIASIHAPLPNVRKRRCGELGLAHKHN